MRFDSLHARGLGPFANDIEVDLRELGEEARIVAVTGDNGAGKSTLLELWAAALFRACPTRGTLASLATRRDAVLEARVMNGQSYTIRHLVDAVSGKGESIVMDADGKPLTHDAKVRSYDTWAARKLPPPEVLYASTFAAQGSGGFLEMKPAERKRVLLRALGIEHLEAMASKAGERARAAGGDVRLLRTRIADARAGAPEAAAARGALDLARVADADAAADLEAAQGALDAAREQASEIERCRAEAEAHRRTHSDRVERHSRARNELVGVEARIGNNRHVLERAEEIRAAQQAALDLDAEIQRTGSLVSIAEIELAACLQSQRETASEIARIEDRWRAAAKRQAEAQERLVDDARVQEAIDRLDVLRTRRDGILEAQRQAEEEVDGMRARCLGVADARIGGLRGGLQAIAEGQGSAVVASATLAEDDARARGADEAARVVAEYATGRDARRRMLEAAELELRVAERQAARAGEMQAAHDALAQAEREIEQAQKALSAERWAERGCAENRMRGEEVHRGYVDELQAARSRREALEPTLRFVEPLASAEARVAELAPVAERLRSQVAELQAAIDALGEPPEVPERIDVAELERDLRATTERQREAHDALLRADDAYALALAAEERVSELQADMARAEVRLADWTRLAADLGRDGLQAMEIDAAGPELTQLANELLHECVSTRWTVSIETTRSSADGKRQLEGCEVRVVDTVGGRDAAAETFSGGERVILGEAVSLALSVLACRRAGVERPTLVRDESGAALDPENGRAYVSMLRRAADLIGADRVLVVSHSPELVELADARIIVAGGKVEVQA